jgi:GT2 family glycosyltransferase
MKLSIVIVNYNVRFFLEQCLYSVRKALEGIEAEVFVVDNNSVDGSCALVREKFPEVSLIENKENRGFSRANNQAINLARGEYILLLNPDTVVEADTFRKIIAFMDHHPDAGGLGVRMIDGKGNFLPESKRGLPTPMVAFFKIFGLSRIFPKSRIFGRYHLGYLDPDMTHQVDVLSGAFMLLRGTALAKTGLLDEGFFMYGEDIDLSYRITEAGYRNYYFPEARIIHYKGESTKKSSINYVLMFYRAMVIFARKHFSQKNARVFSLLIHSAIYLRAIAAIFSRFLFAIMLPLLDAVMAFAGIYFITNYWEAKVIFPEGGSYPPGFMTVVVPIYILIWLTANYLNGTYDRPVRINRIFLGTFLGTLFILVIYALLPEKYRFSRAIILLGATWSFVSMIGLRILLHLTGFRNARFDSDKNRRFIIIGDGDEAKRVYDLLQKSYFNPGFIGLVSSGVTTPKNSGFIGNLGQVREIIMIYRIDEVIFCSKDISHQMIMDLMSSLQGLRVDYKIAPEESISIIGSNSINTAGDLYTVNINTISNPANRRNKRIIDILTSLAVFIALPALLFLSHRPSGLIPNLARVLVGKRSWVGYIREGETLAEHLPLCRKGVLNPEDAFKKHDLSDEMKERLNLVYARDYNLQTDIRILVKGWRHLGRKS